MRDPKSIILCALAVSGLLVVLFKTCPAQESHRVVTEDNPRFADTQSNEGERSKLPPNDRILLSGSGGSRCSPAPTRPTRISTLN